MSQTLNMAVDNVSFLLDRAGADCAPLQFIREFHQNAIEAILRTPEKTGKINWGVCPFFLETGLLKLQVADTGCGMSGEEMVQHMNHLSSSGGRQALDGNYGLGAKISGLKYNQAGLLYASWRTADDPGAAILLWRDPHTNEYGIKRHDLGGVFSNFVIPDPRFKTKEIQEAGHGTVVVFLGNADDENTFSEPPLDSGVSPTVVWVARYLEARYLDFPEGIEVHAQDVDKKNYVEGWRRLVSGRNATIGKQAATSGVVELATATANWWILKSGDEKTEITATHRIKGCTAAVYHGEIYEQTERNASRPRLQQFGVVFGYENVVICVKPRENSKLTTDMARTQLRENSLPLPWESYAEEFRDKLPQEIKDLEEEISSATKSDTRAIKDRLASIMNFFHLSRFCVSPKGGAFDIVSKSEMGVAPPPSGPGPEPPPPSPDPDPRTIVKRRPGSRGTLLFGVTAKEGTTAVEVLPTDLPQVYWFPISGQSLPEDLLDRAATYEPRTNTISANAEFAGVADLIDYWSKTYRGVTGMEHAVMETVKEAFEMQLIETILGLQSLKNRKHWTDEQIEKAWSSEALTAAVASRSQLVTFIKRQLAKLGGAASATSSNDKL